MEFKDLVGPEKVVVERLALDEPLIVVNAWLVFFGYKPCTEDSLVGMKGRFADIIAKLKADTSQDFILEELNDIRDKLVKSSGDVTQAKDLALLSNALNAVSKTINDYIEKKKAKATDNTVDIDEYLKTLKFLESEGFLVFSEGKFDELRKSLFETVSQE